MQNACYHKIARILHCVGNNLHDEFTGNTVGGDYIICIVLTY